MESKTSALVDFASGVCAGVANVIVCAPLDTARTRLQTQNIYEKKYNGIISALSKTYREEGLKSLYQGLNASIIAYPSSWSIYFMLYNRIRSYFGDLFHNDTLGNVAGASIAGLTGSIITNPLWLIRARMQVQSGHSKYTSVADSLRLIIKEEGFFALFNGCKASMLGTIHVVVQFPLYELTKKLIKREYEPPHILEMILCTIFPKFVASLCSYPHEVLRARLFMSQKDTDQMFTGLWSLMKYTWQNEGIKGFYSGFSVNLLRVMPSTFVTLYTYEHVSYFLSTHKIADYIGLKRL
ncbi:unnamed protein product [Blepharisma stoltei]|uniref:Uncharacterized protein n=1 Tax=Blepharisma stoltei TaxID=1481888 RepID=A0AAU9KN61_9CILI|nr:unnamed protein product [Blepharisma stoltei]